MNPNRRPEWFDNDAFWRDLYPLLARRSAEADEDTSRLLTLTKPQGQAVLDLGCGPGRFALALAQRGFAVTGVDRTKFYLDKARAQARKARLRIEWVRQDMRDFVRPDSYDLALSLLSSFGYFEDQREDLRMLRNLLTSLRPGGVCLVDVMGKEVLARIAQPTTSEIVDEDTTLVVRHEICSDWTRIRNEWLFIQGDKIRRYQFEHTVYSGQELRARLEQAGFVDVKLYGGFDGADYGLNARRLIAVGRKPLSRRGL